MFENVSNGFCGGGCGRGAAHQRNMFSRVHTVGDMVQQLKNCHFQPADKFVEYSVVGNVFLI
jgi:hypothetical protein